ncbi:MAG: hypothetical protein ACJAVV_002753 [Alphaproteobacteria bacterium]|jgi:hypothetical protein
MYRLFGMIVLLSMSLGGADVLAQEAGNQGISANAKLSLLSDSNILRNSNELEDDLVQLAPQISYSNAIGKHQFSAAYNGMYTKYSEQSPFDYENHMAAIGILFDHTSSLATEFNVNYENAIEQPGSTNGVLTNVTDFIQFDTGGVTAAVLYGTQESKGQIVLTFDYRTTDFKDIEQKFRNADRASVNGRYLYRIASRTRLIFEVETENFDYTESTSANDQSSTQNTYSTGIEWGSSAQTSSRFRLGYQTRDFKNPTFTNDDGLFYSLDFTWLPKSYTQFTFGASRTVTESAIQGTAGIIRETYSIDLQHELSSLIVLNSLIQYAEDDISDRTDTSTTFQLGLTYSAKHWLDISLSYLLENRESNDIFFDYDAEVVQLSFLFTFD